MTSQQVRDATNAFYDRISGDFWEEHGISRDEALDGMIAAFQAIGMLTPQQVGGIRFGIKRLEIKAERDRQRTEEERRATLTPEQPKAMSKIIDERFASRRLFSFLRDGAKGGG